MCDWEAGQARYRFQLYHFPPEMGASCFMALSPGLFFGNTDTTGQTSEIKNKKKEKGKKEHKGKNLSGRKK